MVPEETRALCCRLLVAYAWQAKAFFGPDSSAGWARALLDRLLPTELAQKAAQAQPSGDASKLEQLLEQLPYKEGLGGAGGAVGWAAGHAAPVARPLVSRLARPHIPASGASRAP